MSPTSPSDQSVVAVLRRNLLRLRQARAMTQAQLGATAGITRNHYQQLESGKTPGGDIANPRLSTLVSLASALEVTPALLLSPPREHSVWRWFAPQTGVDDAVLIALFDLLTASSQDALDGVGAAFVGQDDEALTVGIGVKAPDGETAVVIGSQLIDSAVKSVALHGTYVGESEVEQGLADLVRTDEV